MNSKKSQSLKNVFPYFCLLFFLIANFSRFVSPGLGMGPSSVWTTIVGTGGIGPVTGYPIHNFLSRVFLFFAPAEHEVWWFNFSNLFWMLLAIVFMTATLVRVLEATLKSQWLRFETVLLVGLSLSYLCFFSPSLARMSYFVDRYTIEALALSIYFYFFIRLILNLSDEKKKVEVRRDFLKLCFLTGLMFFCHAKSFPLVSLFSFFLLLVLIVKKRRLPWFKMIGLFLAGLLPVFYLPLISAQNPFFDWNNPEKLQNILYTLSRKEYTSAAYERPLSLYLWELKRQYSLLTEQWSIGLLGLFPLLWLYVFRVNKTIALSFLFILLYSGEFTTYLQHLRNPQFNEVITRTYRWYISHYYGPYFFFFISFIVLGATLALFHWRGVKKWVPKALVVLFLALNLFGLDKTSQGENQLSLALVKLFEQSIPEGSLFITNSDSVYFNLIYHQMKSGRFQNRDLIHAELAFRPWYLRSVKARSENLWMKSEKEYAWLLQESDKFVTQKGNEFNINAYYRAFYVLVEEFYKSKKDIFMFSDPDFMPFRGEFLRGYSREPAGILYQLRRGSFAFDNPDFTQYDFTQFKKLAARGDFWGQRFLEVFSQPIKEQLKREKIVQGEDVLAYERVLERLGVEKMSK